MREVTIGPPEGDHLSVRVQRRKYPEATDFWDGNWVDAEISIMVRPWRGEYGASLRAEEFVSFRQELQRLHEAGAGEAVFSSTEPWLELKLQCDPLGHIHLRGEAGPEGFGRIFGQTRLVFEVQDFIDQTHLPSIIQQLTAVEDEFPVIGKAGD